MWNNSFCLLAAVALLACLGACGFGGWSRVGGFLSFPAFNSPLLRLTANTDRNPTCWRAPTRELVASFRYLLQLAYGGRGPPGPQGVYASSLRFLRRCPRSTVLPIHVYPSLRRYSFVEIFFSVRSSRCVVFSARCINWRFFSQCRTISPSRRHGGLQRRILRDGLSWIH